METETNTPSEQVEVTEELSNAVESVTPENESYDDAYDKAFDAIDIDNPDMSLFAEETNVEEKPTATVEEDENTVEEVETASQDDMNPFAVDEDGYLVNQLTDRGKEVKVTPEELFQFGNKGLNYEQRNAEVKPFREHLKILQERPDIAVEDLKSLVDLANGNKDAMKHLISKYDVDVYDVDTSEAKYTPDVSNAKVDDVQDIWSDYQKANPSGSEKVSTTFDGISEDFRKEVYTAEIMPLFIKDVDNGMFDELYPETEKIRSLYPNLSWLEAYGHANQRYANRQGTVRKPEDVTVPLDKGNPSLSIDDKVNDIWDNPGVFEEMNKKLSL